MTLYQDAMAAFRRGDIEKTRELSEALRRAGQEVDGLCMLARIAAREGDAETTKRLAAEARALAGDERQERMPLHLQAFGARLAGEIDEARRLYEESIELNRRLDTQFTAGELYNLGFLELNAGKLTRARELFDEALREGAARDYEEIPRLVVLGRGALAVEEGDADLGVRLLSVGEAAFEHIGELLDPDDRAEVDRALEKARGMLDAKTFARAEEEGRKLSLADALA